MASVPSHKIRAVAHDLQELSDLLRVLLEVRVDRDNGVGTRFIDPCPQCCRLARVWYANAADSRVLLGLLRRAIRAAVIDEHNLGVQALQSRH
jgi:hypothetical protein